MNARILVSCAVVFLFGCGPSIVVERPLALSLAGSSSVTPLARQLVEAYTLRNPGSELSVLESNSGAGVIAAGEATANIGMSSRFLKDAEREKYPTVFEVAIARDALGIFVHPSRELSNLTKDQVFKIFTGAITDWSELGQPAGTINVHVREAGSGTRDFFVEAAINKKAFGPAAITDLENWGVRDAVAADPQAIGFASFGALDASVKVLTLDWGSGPRRATEDTVRSGDYPLSRSLLFLTNGAPEGEVEMFIEFCLRPGAQARARNVGYVPIF